MKTLPRRQRPTARSAEKFDYFSRCEDSRRMPEIPLDPEGYSALECFHVSESRGGAIPPCREPELLVRALNGKEWHGVDVTHIAEDYVGRLVFAREIRENYPEWVQRDIFGRARGIARETLRYVPKFVETGEDFTTGPEREEDQ